MQEDTFFCRQKGITLLESLLVLAIIALVSLYAAPVFSQWLTRLSAEADLRRTVDVIRFARQNAQFEDQRTFVSIRPGNHWCIAAASRDNCDCMKDTCSLGDRQLFVSSESFSSTLTSNRFSASRPIHFDGINGSAFDSAGTIELTYENISVKIIISPLGRIRGCESGHQLTGVTPC